jgi:hypothetical protein
MRVFAESVLQLYFIQNLGLVYGASEYLNTWMGKPLNYIQREKYRKAPSLWLHHSRRFHSCGN